MNKETIEITIKAYNSELKIEFPDSITITEFYDKLELLGLFIGYTKEAIDKELNRE